MERVRDLLLPMLENPAAAENSASKKLPGEGFKRPWQLLIKMDAALKAKVEMLFGGSV